MSSEPSQSPSPEPLTPARCAALLKQLFPAVFADLAKPLKLGVRADIQARAPGQFPRDALSAFLRRHTTSTAYLVALTKAEHRFDLEGAASNLGRAVAQAFAAKGDALVLVDLKRESLAAAFGDESPQRMFAPADLRKQEDVDGVVRTALERFGRIDVLCNLAGTFRMGEAVHEMSDATWDLLLDLNARSLLRTAHAVVPAMLKQGSGKIVNVGAYSAQKGAAQMGAYIASKAVVARLTETMAAELRERGINVNAVLPTLIDTPE